ncbi:hypothetical protein [Cognaticolwellia mytili]|uniref:hypothetical protein n=1 Tax=Cognaticolwellia mytili TaxID=1888913 RepID=UPI000A16F574|nr:hypothetical protein [Cognaticolwellia mytili]
MNGDMYQVFVGNNCVANKIKEADATQQYWQLCNRHPGKPVYLAKVTVLATNSAANAALQQRKKV